MVDINLMGDEEENREERQPEESFAQTVNLDLGETSEEEKVDLFSREEQPVSTYPRETAASAYNRPPVMGANAGASRNKAYLLVAVLILFALAAVWIMISTGRKPQTNIAENPNGSSLGGDTTVVEPEIDEPLATETPIDTGFAGTTTPETNVQPPTTTVEKTPMPGVRETAPLGMRGMFASTRIGGYTVSALGQAFNGGDGFSLISYSGNNNSFMVQFSAPSSSAISAVTEAMRRNASPEELRTVSTDGSAVLVLGRVSERAGEMGPAGMQRMGFTEFSAWLKRLAADRGLGVKSFEASQAYPSDGTTHTPVQANFSGDKTAVFQFLKDIADAGPNIAMTKIIVSPADRRLPSTSRVDVVLLFDFIE